MNTLEKGNPAGLSTERDPRRPAVVARDRSADGRSVHPVRTTGVYRRPSCAARLARPESVRFHEASADAEKAAVRARQRRIRDQPSSSDRVLGMTPADHRAGGADTDIRFAVGECSLGSILVAGSDRGVCAILMGDDPDALARDLQDRFPRARPIGGGADFEAWVAEVVGFVEAPALGLDLPLDVRGTAFQQRVWQALREIPAGSTASYTDIADRIGAPKAVRAVARACGANALAVAIPCHRVVGNDGALSGYRWGVARRRALLTRESAA